MGSLTGASEIKVEYEKSRICDISDSVSVSTYFYQDFKPKSMTEMIMKLTHFWIAKEENGKSSINCKNKTTMKQKTKTNQNKTIYKVYKLAE